jgi:D-alanine-D-alanine ligase
MRKIVRSKKSSPTKIAILYHFVPKSADESYYSAEHALVDNQTDEIVEYMKGIFEKKYSVQCVGVSPDNLSALKNLDADLVYNLVDSKAMEIQVAKLLERMKIPFTGTGSQGIINSNNKIKSKSIFLQSKLPTAAHTIIGVKDRISKSMVPSSYPVIIKPAFEHCSIGITNKSIAKTYRHFVTIVKRLRLEHKQPLIAEQFIPGKELQVTVYEHKGSTSALPIAEIAFTKKAKNKWNIYGFDEKWSKEKAIYKSCNFISPPKQLPQDIDAKIKHDAIHAFYAFNMRDYARFDIRYNPEEKQWYFLEGNANAGFDPNPRDAMTVSVHAASMKLEEFILQIVENALNTASERRSVSSTH